MIFMFILLAGSSTRMGSSTLKQFINISKKEIFEYSLETFDKIEKINKIFLVAQKDNFEHINQIILNNEFAGLCLMYQAIHGEEDKKNTLNPLDEQSMIENFDEIFNKD